MQVVECAREVLRHLGVGRRETIYQAALCREFLQRTGILLESERCVPVRYKGAVVGVQRVDLSCATFFVELKAVSRLLPSHYNQAQAYANDLEVPGLLLNFGESVTYQCIKYGSLNILEEPITPKMQTESQTTKTMPKTFNNIQDTALEPKMSSYNIDKGNGKQETRHKISMTIPETDIAPYVTLPPMQVQWSEFSENGDAEAFGKELDDGKQSVSVRCGLPSDRVKQAMPLLEAEQTEALATLKAYHAQMVGYAFDNLPTKGCIHAGKARSKAKKALPKATPEDIEAHARELYIEGAHCGGIVEKEIDDTAVELVVAKRKVCTYQQGVKGRYPPVFHKIGPGGEYTEVEVENYLPRRTLAIIRARPQFFSAPLMYGTTLSLDRDIILVWRPKKRARDNTPSVVPYFEDGDGDTNNSPKKTRIE
jgi:GxxExxY protein